MAQPIWNRTLSEVLQQNTEIRTITSPRTGKEYQAETVLSLEVVSTGSVEEVDGQFSYPIVDTIHQLEYTIKAPKRVDVVFGSQLVFTNVTGGALNNGRGWYKAEDVRVVK